MLKCFVRECHQRKTVGPRNWRAKPECSDMGFGCELSGEGQWKVKKHDIVSAVVRFQFFFHCTNKWVLRHGISVASRRAEFEMFPRLP